MKTWALGYEKSKQKAKATYSKIGSIKCPALDDDIVAFNSKGFNHLVRKGRLPRTKREQKRRFVLVKYIEGIVKNPEAVIEFRQNEKKYKINRHGEEILVTSNAKFWTLVEKIGDCEVRVVIQQIEQGKKTFLSVMGDNIQSR